MRSRLVAAVVIVALVAAACSDDGGDPELFPVGGATPGAEAAAPSEQPTPEPGAPPQTAAVIADGAIGLQTFDIDSEGTLNGATFSWGAIRGIWSALGGTAQLTQPSLGSDPELVVTGAATNGFVQITMAKVTNQSGLVFRLVDASNYWAIVAAPPFATWNVVRVVDGESETVANVGLAPVTDRTVIGVLMENEDLRVMVDGRIRVTLTDPTHMDGVFTGLITAGADATMTRWDDLLIVRLDLDDPDGG